MAEFDLTAEITSALKDWSGDIADGLDELVDEEAKALKQDIVNDSPERTGDYKKGWKIKKEHYGRGNTRAVVHNATNFQRTHLLEKGHAGPNGGASCCMRPAAAAAALWISERMRMSFPFSRVGHTRLVSSTTKSPVSGSTAMLVPVKPVCP